LIAGERQHLQLPDTRTQRHHIKRVARAAWFTGKRREGPSLKCYTALKQCKLRRKPHALSIPTSLSPSTIKNLKALNITIPQRTRLPDKRDSLVSNLNVHNLTGGQVDTDVLHALGNGLKFCPNPPPILRTTTARNALINAIEQAGWKAFFSKDGMGNTNDYDRRLPIAATHKPCIVHVGNGFEAFKERALAAINTIFPHSATAQPCKAANKLVKKLRNINPELKIVPTDKNIGVAILRLEQYDEMVTKHLRDTSTYQAICPTDLQRRLTSLRANHEALVKQMVQHYGRRSHAAKYLLHSSRIDTEIPPFHVLPKLHKPSTSKGELPASRPIVGAVNSISTCWSKLLDVWLSKCKRQHTVLSSAEVLAALHNEAFPKDARLISLDATALYTNIPQEHLRAAVTTALQEVDLEADIPHHLVNSVLDMVLKGNIFKYREEAFVQLRGIAMGTNAAVQLADTFLDKFFDCTFNNMEGVHWFARYIDDVVAIVSWPNTQAAVSKLEGLAPGIDWKLVETTPLPVLDLALELIDTPKGREIRSSLYQKPINIYGYLPWHSAHDRAVFRGFVKAECQRFARACSKRSDYQVAVNMFARRLRARGYPQEWVRKTTHQVDHDERVQQLENAHWRRLSRQRFGREARMQQQQQQQLQPQERRSTHAVIVPFSWDENLRLVRQVTHSLRESEWAQRHGARFVVALCKAPDVQRLVCRSALTSSQNQLLKEKEAEAQDQQNRVTEMRDTQSC
jgi:hypothetical protein